MSSSIHCKRSSNFSLPLPPSSFLALSLPISPFSTLSFSFSLFPFPSFSLPPPSSQCVYLFLSAHFTRPPYCIYHHSCKHSSKLSLNKKKILKMWLFRRKISGTHKHTRQQERSTIIYLYRNSLEYSV